MAISDATTFVVTYNTYAKRFATIRIVVAVSLQDNCGTQAEGPSLLLTKIEVEVKTELNVATIQIVTALCVNSFIAGPEETSVTYTATSLNFEETGSSLVATKPVHEVNLGVCIEASVVNDILATHTPVPVGVIVEACLQLEFQAQNGSDTLGKVDACYCAIGNVPIMQVRAYATFSTN